MGAVSDAASGGTRRDVLIAMRDRIAIAVDDKGTPARDLAALSRRLMDITREIDELDAGEGGADGGDDGPPADAELDPAEV